MGRKEGRIANGIPVAVYDITQLEFGVVANGVTDDYHGQLQRYKLTECQRRRYSLFSSG